MTKQSGTKQFGEHMTEAVSLLPLPAACVLAWLVDTQPPGFRIAVHFGWNGAPNGWAKPGELALGIVALAVVLALAVLWLAVLKRRAGVSPARRLGLTCGQAISGLSSMGTSMMLTWLSGATGTPLQPAMVPALVSLLLVATGAVLGRVPPNPVVGLRTPWTLANRQAWDRANRLAGKLTVLTGLGGFLASLVSMQAATVVLGAGLAMTTGASVYESWKVSKTTLL